MPWLLRGTLAIAIGAAAILSMLTPLSAYLETTLTLHMIAQHFVYLASGFLLAYGSDSMIWVASRLSRKASTVYVSMSKANSRLNKRGVVTFLVAGIVLSYWYYPTNFDWAAMSDAVNLEMHLSLLVAGGLAFIGSKMLTKRVQRFSPIIVGKAMGLFGTFMLLTTTKLYSAYPAAEQAQAGVAFIIIMLMLDFTLMPIWLYDYFGRGVKANPRAHFG